MVMEPDSLADWLASYMRGLHGEVNPTPHDHRFAQQKQGASVARMLRAALANGALTPEDLGMVPWEERCPCVHDGPSYANAGNPDHDGSPVECPDCYLGARRRCVSEYHATVGPDGAVHDPDDGPCEWLYRGARS